MIEKKNFSNMDPALIPVDTEYVSCNFTQTVPDTSGTDPVGVRLFPGDDTPRTFTLCNLTNCIPPPGSSLIDCTTNVVNYGVFDRDETITVDGAVVSTKTFTKLQVLGYYDPDTETYIYHQSPIEAPE